MGGGHNVMDKIRSLATLFSSPVWCLSTGVQNRAPTFVLRKTEVGPRERGVVRETRGGE